MNKKDKNFAIGLIAGIILSLSISISSSLLVAYFNANRDWVGSLIGSLGNIIGGIIGGYIAYFVAKVQILETRKADEHKEIEEAVRLSILLKEELRLNSVTLSSIITAGNVDPNIIKQNLTRESWLYFASKVVHKLDETVFIKINIVYRRFQIFETMSSEEIKRDLDITSIQNLKSQCDQCIDLLDQFKSKQETATKPSH